MKENIWYETCKCKCRLDGNVCNNKKCWNEDKCRCKCKELIDKGVCNKEFIWNSSNCECECDKSCDIDEYLDYSNCECRKRLVDKLIEECTEKIDETKITSKNEHENKCSFCSVHIVLFSIFFIISIGIGIYFVYYKYMSRNEKDVSKYDYVYQTTI